MDITKNFKIITTDCFYDSLDSKRKSPQIV